MLTKLPALAATLWLLSCARPVKPYAIRDYPDTLQPWLTRVINTGIVGYDTATIFIRTNATDSEISMLGNAENPILRAIALEEMTHRPGFNHNQVFMTHLNDTAIIIEDVGEWGIRPTAITDFMIHQGRWKTNAARDSIADEIILHNDNPRSAYLALDFLPFRPDYHDHITRMVLRDRDDIQEIEYALFALAKYRRKADIPLIKDVLLTHGSELTENS